jgi:hypothetical protein
MVIICFPHPSKNLRDQKFEDNREVETSVKRSQIKDANIYKHSVEETVPPRYKCLICVENYDENCWYNNTNLNCY